MPQSLTKLYAHLIFSTKNRQPYLDEEIRPRVHAYLATIIRNLDSPWVVVGGVADHMHVLFDPDKLLHDVLPTMNREDDTPQDIREWIAAHS